MIPDTIAENFCALTRSLPCKTFHVQLMRMCPLQPQGGVFCKCLWKRSAKYFLSDVLCGGSVHCWTWLWNSWLLLLCSLILPLKLVILGLYAGCSGDVCTYIDDCCLLLLDWAPYHCAMTFVVFYHWPVDYFNQYTHSYSCSLLVLICVEYLFPFPNSQFLCTVKMR